MLAQHCPCCRLRCFPFVRRQRSIPAVNQSVTGFRISPAALVLFLKTIPESEVRLHLAIQQDSSLVKQSSKRTFNSQLLWWALEDDDVSRCMAAWTRTDNLSGVFPWATKDNDPGSVRVDVVEHLRVGCVAVSFVPGLVNKYLFTEYLFADPGDV